MIRKVNNNIKNIKKIIIILFIILICLIIFMMLIYNNPTNKNLRYIYNSKKEGNIAIMPTNVDKLFVKYKGNIEQRSLYKTMYWFADELVEKYYLATNELSEDDINAYFNNNFKIIEKELGITENEKFCEFCENLRNNLNGSDIEITSYTIYPDSIKILTSYTKCSMVLKYNNTQKIAFYLFIQNSLNKNKTPIYYEACTDESVLSYEYIDNDYETPDSIEPTGKVIN